MTARHSLWMHCVKSPKCRNSQKDRLQTKIGYTWFWGSHFARVSTPYCVSVESKFRSWPAAWWWTCERAWGEAWRPPVSHATCRWLLGTGRCTAWTRTPPRDRASRCGEETAGSRLTNTAGRTHNTVRGTLLKHQLLKESRISHEYYIKEIDPFPSPRIYLN